MWHWQPNDTWLPHWGGKFYRVLHPQLRGSEPQYPRILVNWNYTERFVWAADCTTSHKISPDAEIPLDISVWVEPASTVFIRHSCSTFGSWYICQCPRLGQLIVLGHSGCCRVSVQCNTSLSSAANTCSLDVMSCLYKLPAARTTLCFFSAAVLLTDNSEHLVAAFVDRLVGMLLQLQSTNTCTHIYNLHLHGNINKFTCHQRQQLNTEDKQMDSSRIQKLKKIMHPPLTRLLISFFRLASQLFQKLLQVRPGLPKLYNGKPLNIPEAQTMNSTWKVAVSYKIIMTTSATRPCFTTQHQTCKTKTIVCKTKTDFFGSQTSPVLRPTVSDHFTGSYILNAIPVSLITMSSSERVAITPTTMVTPLW